LLRRLRAERPGVIATNTRFYPTSLLGFAAARLARRPLYHIEHGSRTYRGPSRAVNAVAGLVDRTWGRMIIRRADRVFAASEDVRDFVLRTGAKEAEVVTPRVDTSVFRPDEALRLHWRRRLGIGPDEIVVLFCGRLVRTKGVLDLAEAFGRLTAERAMLLYAGDGPDRSRIVESPRVRCLGSLDDDGVVGVLNAADVFVNPSHNEGIPSSVIEAGAVGLAVVATDVGGTREIVTSPDAGVLVPPGDVVRLHAALESMIADPDARTRFGAALREVVLRRYAWTDDAVTPFVR
jgi:glycosyltransferase involved in cell wall biosynthesis